MSLVSLEISLEINPEDPYAIAYKALLQDKVLGKSDAAQEYVEKFKALPNPPIELVELLRTEELINK